MLPLGSTTKRWFCNFNTLESKHCIRVLVFVINKIKIYLLMNTLDPHIHPYKHIYIFDEDHNISRHFDTDCFDNCWNQAYLQEFLVVLKGRQLFESGWSKGVPKGPKNNLLSFVRFSIKLIGMNKLYIWSYWSILTTSLLSRLD